MRISNVLIGTFIAVSSFVLTSFQPQGAGTEALLRYVDKYKEIAISEMKRAGVPASIKLAQGILESGSGTSSLSVKANNHFGVKCHKNWKGKTYHHKDDDYKNGELIQSCFRKYDNAEESWIAHTDFLVRGQRYQFLFDDYKVTEYKKWAHGLKKAGYATSKTYATRLIDIIEKYDLDKYDKMKPCNVDKSCRLEAKKDQDKIYTHNDIQMVFINTGETIYDISKKYDISLKKLRKYNDVDVVKWEMVDGSRVYLQPKKSSYRGKKKFHFVEPGQSMIDIAQYYGIKLETLLKNNYLALGEEPAVREKIDIKGKARKKPLLRGKKTIKIVNSQTKKAPQKKVIKPTKKSTPVVKDGSDEYLDFEEKEKEVKEPEPVAKPSIPKTTSAPTKSSSSRLTHVVNTSETLWSISRKYNVTVEQLKTWNQLNDSGINVGQTLYVAP